MSNTRDRFVIGAKGLDLGKQRKLEAIDFRCSLRRFPWSTLLQPSRSGLCVLPASSDVGNRSATQNHSHLKIGLRSYLRGFSLAKANMVRK